MKKNIQKSKITVSRVYTSEFQKEGTMTAELKQIVTTTVKYPSKSVNNSINGNIFAASDFGFEEQSFDSKETRVTWIDVPTGSTVESVQAKLDTFKEAILYKILSNNPILSDTETYAVQSSEFDVNLATFADRQVVRYPQGSENAGAICKKESKVQYRRIAFSPIAKEDIDSRDNNPENQYLSPNIANEMENHVVEIAGQTI